MTGVAKEGVTSWLSESDNPKRKLKWTWELTQENDTIVGVNTHNPNKIIQEAINNKEIKELLNYKTLKREVKYGVNSKIDIFLQDEKKVDCYVEIKNVHLSRKNFDDLKNRLKETKHLKELTIVAQNGGRAVMLYLIQRNDCNYFKIAEDIDIEYGKAFLTALNAGVEVICIDTILNTSGIDIGKKC